MKLLGTGANNYFVNNIVWVIPYKLVICMGRKLLKCTTVQWEDNSQMKTYFFNCFRIIFSQNVAVSVIAGLFFQYYISERSRDDQAYSLSQV